MSSSRRDEVTKCVSVCVVILFSLEHSKHLKQDASRVLQRGLLRVSWVSKDVLRLFASRMFQGCFKSVSRNFQGYFKGDSIFS